MKLKFWKKDIADPVGTPAKKKKSKRREWFDAIIFAAVAATLIRGLFIEAYVIPSGSMERSLLVGDFLFVSKVNYGARLPMTPIAFPFAHHTMPLIGTKAYWDGIQMKYRRLPGFGQIKRGDVVVFNLPPGDTVVLQTQETTNYYQLVRQMGREAVRNNPNFTIVTRPVDKRENLIKRCQGIAGDTLKIVNGQVFVNGKAAEAPRFGKTEYLVKTDGSDINPKPIQDLHIDMQQTGPTNSDYVFSMTPEQLQIVKGWSFIKQIQLSVRAAGTYDSEIFPNNPRFTWSQDNFGPIIIPKRGWTVQLDSTTIPIYKRAIEIYEGNKVEQKNENELLINGAKSASYTFKMDYYWMMGDNRHNSLDSRFWGFVPEDHVVGKALFLWMSIDDQANFFNKIRWGRLFNGIK